jgi:hypothetical protein
MFVQVPPGMELVDKRITRNNKDTARAIAAHRDY